MQGLLDFGEGQTRDVAPFKLQLLKWVGSKQRFAHEIAAYFPADMRRYFEPFLGSAAVLATLAPEKAIGADLFKPLVEIWQTLRADPDRLKGWYAERWHALASGDKITEYERIKQSYNQNPNGADLVFLCRACYGGVVRFRKADGSMSTPCGVHNSISSESFSRRVDEWCKRTRGTEFIQQDFRQTLEMAGEKDLVYCDPPYQDTQAILYGAQEFNQRRLFEAIDRCRSRGAYVVLSIDGTKRSGNFICDVPIPPGLFRREVFLNCGRSMLRRFQMEGQTLEGEVVTDRLLLTY